MPRIKINQAELEELRKNPQFIEFRVNLNVQADAATLDKPFLVGVVPKDPDDDEYILIPNHLGNDG